MIKEEGDDYSPHPNPLISFGGEGKSRECDLMISVLLHANRLGALQYSPWFRENIWEHLAELNPEYYTPDLMHFITKLSRKFPKFHKKGDNAHLDIHTKKAVLKVSSSVVALLSYTGEQELNQCSGMIIENDGNNGHIVLTSANLIRRPTEEYVMEDKLADSLKVMIYLCDGGSYEGEVCAYDFHYNIAWIRFQSDSSLATAKLRQVDDFINLNPAEEKSFHLRPYSSHFNLISGHAIVAVGCYFAKLFDLMAAPGEFTLDRCDIDCKELFIGTFMTTKCGEGGALINLWRLRQPSLGVVATNFYATTVYHIEKVIQKFPGSCNGVLVEKVLGGKTVHSFLEFLEMMWDKKVGDVLQLSVVRASQNDLLHINMVVDDVTVENFNR
ncbi:hypothetical protein QL285_027917 [Trifolium repens]|nr:hypothetical protein QL285_027917 [Trifolium repens]